MFSPIHWGGWSCLIPLKGVSSHQHRHSVVKEHLDTLYPAFFATHPPYPWIRFRANGSHQAFCTRPPEPCFWVRRGLVGVGWAVGVRWETMLDSPVKGCLYSQLAARRGNLGRRVKMGRYIALIPKLQQAFGNAGHCCLPWQNQQTALN